MVDIVDQLKYFLIPNQFRPGGICYGAGRMSSGDVVTDTVTCIRFGVIYYIEKLFSLVVIVALFYVFYSGAMMLMSFGDENKYTQAKKTLLYALIGVAVAMVSYLIVRFIGNVLGMPRLLETT